MDKESYRLIVEAIIVPMGFFALNYMKDIKQSIQELNVNLAVVVTKQDIHDSRFDSVESRFDNLEHRIGKLEDK